MTILRAVAIAAALLMPIAFAGCGSSTSSATVAANTLDGNWLITGDRTSGQYPYLSTALIVVGTQVTAHGDMGVGCGASPYTGSVGGSVDLSGTLAADGTFSIGETGAAATGSSIQIAITGKAPANGANSWTGTYSFTDLPGYTSCLVNQTGNFTAAALAPINATYAGTVPSVTAGTGPITISMTVAQGTALQSTLLPGAPYYLPLTGSITVAGSPCFTHGTATVATNNPQPGAIAGEALNLSFRMDDGSQLLVTGRFKGADESTITATSLLIPPNSPCTQSAYNGTLTRQ